MQQDRHAGLPDPDPDSRAHSDRMRAFLHARIAAAGGSISFAEYMQHALYAPGLGYYSAGAAKFGAAGDFITAPEVSPLFGRVIARQCADVIAAIDGADILEFGAGSGRLAIDVLRGLADLDSLPRRYRILEVSAELQARQRTLLHSELPELADRVEWPDRLPATHNGVMLANEVLDAMPVERFVRRADGVFQQRVRSRAGGFALTEAPAPAVLVDAVAAIEAELGHALPDAYVSEVSLAAPAWIADIAGSLGQGVVLLFDYGVSRREYYAAQRSQGWLRCHFRHHVHTDPLLWPGIQDLTAWVDFSAVAAAAVDAGLEIAGFLPQSAFLLAGGLAEELADLAELPMRAQLELSAQVKTLTLPGEMGEHFKCLGLRRDGVAGPRVFTATDRITAL